MEPDYDGIVPEGFEVLELPAADYLMFRGEPFEEEDFGKAIQEIWDAEQKYDPGIIGYRWDESNPRIQLEPIGRRGYIEYVAVKKYKRIMSRRRYMRRKTHTSNTFHPDPGGVIWQSSF